MSVNSRADHVSGTTINGTALDDTLIGKAAQNDTLYGNDGNDVLYGDTSNDNLYGGNGADKFVFASALNASTNLDRVYDFVSGTDKIVLDNNIFTGFAAGQALVSGTTFVSSSALNPAATTAGPTILYSTSTGVLSYDADGTGAGAAIAFADLTNSSLINPSISASDFIIL